MNANSITSKIVANVEFVAKLYSFIKTAGGEAIKNPTVPRTKNTETVIEAGKEGISRFNKGRETTDYKVTFDENDIIIVGGEALNIYDYKLSGFKTNTGLTNLVDYIKKSTSDIDIVWWPRVTTTKKNMDIGKEIIVSTSDAIYNHAMDFRIKLEEVLNKNKEIILNDIKELIPEFKNSKLINIDVTLDPVHRLGALPITVKFIIEGKILKVCDISIHDTSSSQTYDMNGERIKTLQFMTEDPVYSTPTPGQDNSILYLDVSGVNIAVPNIAVPNINSFVNQQLLAFNNFVRKKDPKCLINYKRLEFLRKILIAAKNNEIYNKLKKVFGRNNKITINNLQESIGKELNNSIKQYKVQLEKICSGFKNNSNTIVNTLCSTKLMNKSITESTKKSNSLLFMLDHNKAARNAKKAREEAGKRLEAQRLEAQAKKHQPPLPSYPPPLPSYPPPLPSYPPPLPSYPPQPYRGRGRKNKTLKKYRLKGKRKYTSKWKQ